MRTERGLSIKGTRITLYDVMDYVTAGWSRDQIADMLIGASGEEIDAALAFIGAHRELVETEYQEVLQTAREERAYWENRNREQFERARLTPLPPEKAALLRRLREQTGQPVP